MKRSFALISKQQHVKKGNILGEEQEEEEQQHKKAKPLDFFNQTLHSTKPCATEEVEHYITEKNYAEEERILEDSDDEVEHQSNQSTSENKEFQPPTSKDPNYNSDEEVYATAKRIEKQEKQKRNYTSEDAEKYKRELDLPLIDHSKKNYASFNKNLYEAASEIKNLTLEEVHQIRSQNQLKVFGSNIPNPIQHFIQCNIHHQILNNLSKIKITSPTSIQMQMIPVALSGRDALGIAKTGSGKTLAYLLPLLVHVLAHDSLPAGEGPIGLILVPTRELAQQVELELRRLVSNDFNFKVLSIYGGMSKEEQVKQLKKGSDVVIAVPGRLINMIQLKACRLHRVTFVVVDEADKMFDMGFERQVKSILSQIRPDKQALLFSATSNSKIANLSKYFLHEPIKVVVGKTTGATNEDVEQQIITCKTHQQKLEWLFQNLDSMLLKGSVIIFVSQKQNCEEISSALCQLGFRAASIHGDKNQEERDDAITAFKNKTIQILVATDVASRGIDVEHVGVVINFDLARSLELHTHRVGRTGRAGRTGVAISLLVTPDENKYASILVQSLESAGQSIPQHVLELASQDSEFMKQRQRMGIGKESAEMTLIQTTPDTLAGFKRASSALNTNNNVKKFEIINPKKT